MDMGDLEWEKGIIILVKNIVVYCYYLDGIVIVINVIDILGYVDFGGEVECGLFMVDGVLLLVDVFEGLLLQMWFVLCKVLVVYLLVILVVNKIDWFDVCIVEVVDVSYDLLLDVVFDFDDEVVVVVEYVLGLLMLYVFGCVGVVSIMVLFDGQVFDGINLDLLFEVFEKYVLLLKGELDVLLQVLVINLDVLIFLGWLVLICIYNGCICKGQQVVWICQVDGQQIVIIVKIIELLVIEGVECKLIDVVVVGDIVVVVGLFEIMIGDMLVVFVNFVVLFRIIVDELVILVIIGINILLLVGKVGGYKFIVCMV